MKIQNNYECFHCHREFTRNFKPGNSDRPYCSKSCAAKHNNKESPKRKIEGACKICGKPISATRLLCKEHRRDNLYKALTLKTYRERFSVKGKHPSWANSHIRNFARSWNKDLQKFCEVCGYDKHVELAHIRAISDFPDTATLLEVNRKENIRVLCRNHHWEFDNGLL